MRESDRRILSALTSARHDLVFLGGCTHTDRPDFPLSPETSWKTDVSGTLAAIDAAIAALTEQGRRTDPECDRCSSAPQTALGTDRANGEQERSGSRKPEGERS